MVEMGLAMETEVTRVAVLVRVKPEAKRSAMRTVMRTVKKVVTRSLFVCPNVFLPVWKQLGSAISQIQ